MLILLDCRPLLEEAAGERSHIIFLAVATLARERGVEWIFVVDRSGREAALPLPADARVIRQGTLPGKIGWRRWYNHSIPRLARQHHADWVMLTGGIAAASSTARQCIWMPEAAGSARSSEEGWQHASLVFCFSEAVRSQASPEDAGKFVLIHPWPSATARPLSISEKETFRQAHTQGKEYFWADLTTAEEEGVVQLLKAFSLFKKRQLSNLQLVLAGSSLRPEGQLKKLIDTYKYRQDLHWWEPEFGKEAAYAQLFPFKKNTLGVPLLDAWKMEIPVIIGKETGLQELAGDSALAADLSDPASLAGHLMVLYKDEKLRRIQIDRGSARLPAFDARLSTDRLWAALSGQSG